MLMSVSAMAQKAGGEVRRSVSNQTASSVGKGQKPSADTAKKKVQTVKKKQPLNPNSLKSAQKAILDRLVNNMVYVAGGKFVMGASGQEVAMLEGDKFAVPSHHVTLTGFNIGKYEVTQEEWEAVMGVNPSNNNKGGKFPVEDVEWEDCQEFITRLNMLTGKKFRLPTEAEWEYAARGGNNSKGGIYAGSNTLGNVAWFKNNSGNRTHEVGQKQANELGLFDMTGNVNEWVDDVLRIYRPDAMVNPRGQSLLHNNYILRVVRGGSVCDVEKCSLMAYRSVLVDPNIKSFDDVGLRLAMDSEASDIYKKTVLQNLINNMVAVEGGTFNFRDGVDEEGKPMVVNEKGQKVLVPVKLTSFAIGKYVVTQEEWDVVMGSNPSFWSASKKPVTNVSWDDCQLFIAKLNEMTGRKFRLPTEAEWEYAARGGKMSKKFVYAGSNDYQKVACCQSTVADKPVPADVGTKLPNELGLYDMSGNVWEWCSDWFAGEIKEKSPTNSKGPSTGTKRVLRGGAFSTQEVWFRVHMSYGEVPGKSSSNVGFRLAL